jgi:hypothetical protein
MHMRVEDECSVGARLDVRAGVRARAGCRAYTLLFHSPLWDRTEPCELDAGPVMLENLVLPSSGNRCGSSTPLVLISLFGAGRDSRPWPPVGAAQEVKGVVS